MMLISKEIPQADDIDRVITTVQCLYKNGYVDHFSLCVVTRQVQYYLDAARILGLVDSSFKITPIGVVVATSRNPYPIVADQFKKSGVYHEWENWCVAQGSSQMDKDTAKAFLSNYFASASLPKSQSLTDNQNGTGTISRRAKTLGDWSIKLHQYM